MYMRMRSARSGGAGGQHLVEGGVGLLKFALLHQADCRFILVEGLREGSVGGLLSGECARLLGGSLHSSRRFLATGVSKSDLWLEHFPGS